MPFLHVHLWYCGARSSVHLFSCRGSEKGEFEKKPFSGAVPRFSGGGKNFSGKIKEKREVEFGIWEEERRSGEGRIRRINRSKDERGGGGEEKGTRRTMTVTGILSRGGGRGREEKRKKADFPYIPHRNADNAVTIKSCVSSLSHIM